MPDVDLAWVARNFDVDCVLLQFSGANWHPHVYTYPEAKKSVLARRKILTKYHHVADVVHALDPAVVVPCAGPPCFLDDELFDLNFSEHSIFPAADDFYEFARSAGFAERVRILMPGDELLRGRDGQALSERNLELPPYTEETGVPELLSPAPPPDPQGPLGCHPTTGGATAGSIRRLLPAPRARQSVSRGADRWRVLDRDIGCRARADLRRLRRSFRSRPPLRRRPLDLPPLQ